MKKLSALMVLILIFGALLFAFYYGLFFFIQKQGGFSIRSITVTGLRYVSQEEVIRLSDFQRFKSILEVNLFDTALRISQHPLIEYAVVRRELPNEILIDIKEIKPVARFFLREKEIFLGKKGEMILQTIGHSLPLFRLDYPLASEKGRVVDSLVLLLLDRLADYRGEEKISSVIIKKKEGVYLTFESLPETLFYLGHSFGDSLILKRVEGIVRQIKRKGIKLKYVDVNRDNAVGVVD